MATSTKSARVREKLLTARQKKLIIQFSRPFEPGTFSGYVIDVGPAFFLLAALNDGFEFEHYTCLRLADVRGLECPAKHTQFYSKVRQVRGDEMPAKIKINLADAASILDSVRNSLVTIHREKVEPDICNIGYMLYRDKAIVELLEIDSDAQWESKPTYFRINQITRIDLPGPYERALLSVGGEP